MVMGCFSTAWITFIKYVILVTARLLEQPQQCDETGVREDLRQMHQAIGFPRFGFFAVMLLHLGHNVFVHTSQHQIIVPKVAQHTK